MDQKVHLEKLAQKPKVGFSEFTYSRVLLLTPGSESGFQAARMLRTGKVAQLWWSTYLQKFGHEHSSKVL